MPNPPLSPEEEAKVASYWGALDKGAASNGIAAPSPAGAPASAPSPVDPIAAGAANLGIEPPAGEKVYNDFLPAPDVAGPPAPIGKVSAVSAPLAASPSAPVPTPKDDAEFAAFRAKQDADAATKEAKVASYWGGAPAKANPDPYGVESAHRAQMQSFDDQKAAKREQGDAEAQKLAIINEHQQSLARMQQEDAAIANAERAYASKHFDDGMQEIGRQLDDVRAKKIDPLRQMKEQPALGVISVLGGALGGFYQGFTGGPDNQFLAHLDRQIDRGIAEDERQIRDNKFALDQGVNLLAQQRSQQKDDELASLQTRNLSYEAAKQQISADAADADIPAVKARADDAIAQINGAQAQLAEQIAARKQAQAAAAAGAQFAQAKEVQQAYKEAYEKVLTATGEPAIAETEARRMVQVMYLGGAGPRPAGEVSLGGGMTREQRGKAAADHADAQRVSDEFNVQVDELKRHPALHNLGIGTSLATHFGQRLAPDSSATEQDIEQINTQILQAVGKVAKDADGKPNIAMIERLERRFSIQPSDTKEMAIRKLEGARSTVNALARQQGATGAPRPNQTMSVASDLGAKPVR